jgi:protein involved in polysaccharide export with SLBB domain
MTMNDAILAAGGFTEFAGRKIWWEHNDGSSQYLSWLVPVTNNPVLRPGDLVIDNQPPPVPVVSQVQFERLGPPPLSIYLGGQFNKPGRYPWTNGMTLNDAILTAGGFTDFAGRKIMLKHWDGTWLYLKWHPPITNNPNPALEPGDDVFSQRFWW